MLVTLRQIQEKCREQRHPLYAVFVDLTKAFDSVNRPALWLILKKYGVPPKFLNITKQLHEGMQARVIYNGEASEPFKVQTGVKQGCVLAPTLFALYFAGVLAEVKRNLPTAGIHITFRTDGKLFNHRRFSAPTKCHHSCLMDLLFADDCALVAHSHHRVQEITNCFTAAYKNFGPTINIKKQSGSFNQPTFPPFHLSP